MVKETAQRTYLSCIDNQSQKQKTFFISKRQYIRKGVLETDKITLKLKIWKKNKDLPKEEQLRIILRNYDSKKAECDALVKENSELRKTIKEKDVLYKNMLDRFNGLNGKAVSKENWEARYNQLKADLEKRNKQFTTMHNQLQKARSILDSLRGVFCGAYNKLEDYCAAVGIGHEVIISKEGDGLVYDREYKNMKQEDKFVSYVRDIISVYKKTGALRGISLIAGKYNVSSLTKEQFFKYGLNCDDMISDEYIRSLYEKAKNIYNYGRYYN